MRAARIGSARITPAAAGSSIPKNRYQFFKDFLYFYGLLMRGVGALLST
jgi:hypothetical protein